MSLFSQQNTVHSKDQQRKTTLAELGGAGAGAGLGLLAGKAGNIKYKQEALKAGLQQSQDLTDSENNWRTMIGLTNGKIDLKDLSEDERQKFKRLLRENEDDLAYMKENPHKVQPLLKEMSRGKVEPLFPGQATPSKTEMFLESLKPKKPIVLGGNVKPIFEDEERMMFPHMVENPALYGLTPFLGLAGMYGAGMMARKHFDKENKGKQEEHDLSQLQDMLLKLKAKEPQSN